jgi:hypothetical protein
MKCVEFVGVKQMATGRDVESVLQQGPKQLVQRKSREEIESWKGKNSR